VEKFLSFYGTLFAVCIQDVSGQRYNNNNNIHICIAPYGRNFRGVGPGSVLVGVRRGKRVSLGEEKCWLLCECILILGNIQEFKPCWDVLLNVTGVLRLSLISH